jgi:hypothetical protein
MFVIFCFFILSLGSYRRDFFRLGFCAFAGVGLFTGKHTGLDSYLALAPYVLKLFDSITALTFCPVVSIVIFGVKALL